MKFEQNWLRASEEKSFENVNRRTHRWMDALTDRRTDDGRKVITIAHPEHNSGELKIWPNPFNSTDQKKDFTNSVEPDEMAHTSLIIRIYTVYLFFYFVMLCLPFSFLIFVFAIALR